MNCLKKKIEKWDKKSPSTFNKSDNSRNPGNGTATYCYLALRNTKNSNQPEA